MLKMMTVVVSSHMVSAVGVDYSLEFVVDLVDEEVDGGGDDDLVEWSG